MVVGDGSNTVLCKRRMLTLECRNVFVVQFEQLSYPWSSVSHRGYSRNTEISRKTTSTSLSKRSSMSMFNLLNRKFINSNQTEKRPSPHLKFFFFVFFYVCLFLGVLFMETRFLLEDTKTFFRTSSESIEGYRRRWYGSTLLSVLFEHNQN